MSYVTVFEITHEAIPLWIPLFFVIFSLFATIFFLGTRDADFITKLFFRGFFLLLISVCAFFAVLYFVDRKHDLQAYRGGKYKVVEGPVEHYLWAAKHECFTVRGVEFCHGTANQVGWDPPLRLGPSSWPVSLTPEGRPVRVVYTGDQYPRIFRLDVGSSSR